MALSEIIIINGVFSLLVVIVFIVVGVQLALQYRKRKEKVYLQTGIAWIGVSEPWWPSSISFLVALFNGTGINIELYMILNNAFLPIFLTLWLIVMCQLMKIKKKFLILILNIAISAVLEILMLYFLFTNTPLVGTKLTPVDIDFGPIAAIFLLYILLVFLVFGFIFAIKTLKLDDLETKIRGKFLLIAFILYLIGAILELIITFPQNRIILLVSAVIFYIGFVMPEKIKKIFIKSKK